MHFKLVCFCLFFLSTSQLISQPGVQWIRKFDAQAQEAFYDVYATHDDHFVAVGGSGEHYNWGGRWLVVKVDDQGQTVWNRTYGNNVRGAIARSVIETDDGDFVVVGTSGLNGMGGQVDVMRVDSDGEQIWRHQYLNGEGKAIIELKSGELLICGASVQLGFLLMIDGQGRELWHRTYDIGSFGYFNAMRETENQVLLAGEGIRDNRENILHTWLLKADMESEGGIVWERIFRLNNNYGYGCNTLVSCEGGFAFSGDQTPAPNYIAKVNQMGEVEWSAPYEMQIIYEWMYGLTLLDEGIFALAGSGQEWLNVSRLPMIIFTHSNGIELGRFYCHIMDFDGFETDPNNTIRSIVTASDNSTVSAGLCMGENTSYDGFILKTNPISVGPQFLSWSPEDTILYVLPGDSLRFAVHIQDQWDERLDLYWYIGEDTLSLDTAVTIPFNDFNEFDVHCSVNGGGRNPMLIWHVNVVDFYLCGFKPEELDTTVGRRSALDFVLDVAHTENVNPTYQWNIRSREGDEEIVGTDSVRIEFGMTGNYQISTIISNGQRWVGVDWSIDVVSPLWSWVPEIQNFRAPIDSIMDFELIPFNPASDSLSYAWVIGEDTLTDDFAYTTRFRNPGQYILHAYIWDGSDLDSVAWEIECYEPNGVNSGQNWLNPRDLALATPSPNPFNAATTLRYNLPLGGQVSVNVFDTGGRLITSLVNGIQIQGTHQVTWNATGGTSGIYFVVLETGGEVRIQKVVMVR